MFWKFLVFVGLAASFTQLGASSVMVGILATGLKAAIFIIAALAVVLFWKNKKKQDDQPAN